MNLQKFSTSILNSEDSILLRAKVSENKLKGSATRNQALRLLHGIEISQSLVYWNKTLQLLLVLLVSSFRKLINGRMRHF